MKFQVNTDTLGSLGHTVVSSADNLGNIDVAAAFADIGSVIAGSQTAGQADTLGTSVSSSTKTVVTAIHTVGTLIERAAAAYVAADATNTLRATGTGPAKAAG